MSCVDGIALAYCEALFLTIEVFRNCKCKEKTSTDYHEAQKILPINQLY